MRLLDYISFPAWLGVQDHEPADHSTIPLAALSMLMPFVHFNLQSISNNAALLAPVLGAFLVLCKIAAIVLNEIYRPIAHADLGKSPAPKKRAPRKAKVKTSARKPTNAKAGKRRG